jgi:hypothetical protein
MLEFNIYRRDYVLISRILHILIRSELFDKLSLNTKLYLILQLTIDLLYFFKLAHLVGFALPCNLILQ